MDEIKHFESLYPPQTRERELSELIPFIQKGLSTQLMGLPGSGKNNILNLLSYNKGVRQHNLKDLEPYVHFVYLDCSEIRGRSPLDATKFLLISLSYSLNERGMSEEAGKIDLLMKDSLKFQDELILFQALKQSIDYLCEEKKYTVVFSMDRFHEYIPDVTTQFFNNLKVLRNRAKFRFSCIFAVNRPLEEVLEPQVFADFYDFIVGNFIYIRLNDPAGIEFRLSYLEKTTGKKADTKIKEELIRLTGGHGKLTRAAYEAVLTDKPEGDLDKFLMKKSAVLGALYEIWQSLLPSEQLVLKKGDLDLSLQEQYPYLFSVGLLDEKGFTIPLFATYIYTVPVVSTDKIHYDIDKNEIILGETPISELLSPSEFKLLRFLIQNKGRLLTKDEIIQAVWSDQKSQEGVTDQALDQIMYRLRKKVEADPNHPHFIQTLKGRGYKFED